MITEDDFAVAADVSPEMAFVRLERKFRDAYEWQVGHHSESDGSWHRFTIAYMNHTIAVARELGLPLLGDFIFQEDGKLMRGFEDLQLPELYAIFRQRVDEFVVRSKSLAPVLVQ